MKLPKINTDSVNYTDFQFEAGDFVFFCSDEHPSGIICMIEESKDRKHKIRYSDKQKRPIWAKDNQLVPVGISDKFLEQVGFEMFKNILVKDEIIITKIGTHLYKFNNFPIRFIHELQHVYFLYTSEHLKIIK